VGGGSLEVDLRPLVVGVKSADQQDGGCGPTPPHHRGSGGTTNPPPPPVTPLIPLGTGPPRLARGPSRRPASGRRPGRRRWPAWRCPRCRLCPPPPAGAWKFVEVGGGDSSGSHHPSESRGPSTAVIQEYHCRCGKFSRLKWRDRKSGAGAEEFILPHRGTCRTTARGNGLPVRDVHQRGMGYRGLSGVMGAPRRWGCHACCGSWGRSGRKTGRQPGPF